MAAEPSSRDRILEGAAALFREHGYQGTGMRELADRAGVAKATLYHHFPSKAALLYQIVQHTVDEATPRLREIAAEPLPASRRLREAVGGHVRQLISDLDNVSCFVEEGRFLPPDLLATHLASRDGYESLFRGILEDGIREGSFCAVDVRLAAFALLGMCNWTARWYRPGGELDAEEIAGVFGDLAVSAMSRGPGAARIPPADSGRTGP
jgi:AcrR family transcriptional regulator